VGTKLVAFEKTTSPIALQVRDFVGGEGPRVRVDPLPFVKKKKKGQFKQPRALLRLSVDGNSGEFWLPAWFSLAGPPDEEEQAVVAGDDHRVELVMTYEMIDLGFQLYLHDFTRKVDPGSPMESHYSSLVDVLDLAAPPNRLREKVLITMNEPLTATDPQTGRAYRFYQADFDFVAKPGDPRFDAHVYRDDQFSPPVQRDALYDSRLSVNYDPGRGVKYAGSLLVVAGIATIFYMRAYFFRRRSHERGKAARRPAGPRGREVN
jgi:hypothetical protein